jgi:predicted enzyme related to lactoylglutathione lyase
MVLRYNNTVVFNNERIELMGQPVVHFEIIGTEPGKLRGYYGELFGWEFATGGPVVQEVSEAGNYGYTEGSTIPGGVGGGAGYDPHVVFYVGVPDVEAALQKAERLGGTRVTGPARSPGVDLVIAQFSDPEGNVIGLAGTG